MRLGFARRCSLLLASLAWLGAELAGERLPQPPGEHPLRIVSPPQPLFSSIGKLGGAMGCTGVVVVDPRIVISAAHCVVEPDTLLVREEVSFRIGDQAGTEFATFRGRVERLGSARQYAGHTDRDEPLDWAIIVLDEVPTGIRPLALRSLHRSEPARLKGRILLAAYSGDVVGGERISAYQRCSILEIRWEVFVHDCKASAGSSGAPLLIEDAGWFAVVGINTATFYVPDRSGGPGEFGGAAVRSSSFESAVTAVHDDIAPQ